MANGNELREFANQLRSEENLSTSQIQRDPRYIAKQEEIAEQREQQLDEKANIEAKNLFNVVNNIDSENITSSVANEYFDLNNLESKDATTDEYYLTPTGDAPLYFKDPRPTPIMDSSVPLLKNRYNQLVNKQEFEPGEMIIFPSWLEHGVSMNRTDEVRVSLACNFRVTI